MKTVFAIVFSFVLAGSLSAGLKFEKYLIDESVPQGTSNYDFSFKFKNEGDSHVKITGIRTDCGCTVAKNDKNSYAPEESGEIKGVFSIGDRTGIQEKTIYIQTDDIGQSTLNLRLKVHIEPIVTVRPSLAFWKIGAKPKCKTVAIKANEKSKAEIISIESDNENFTLAQNVDPKNQSIIQLKITPKSTAQEARALIKIKAKTNNSEKAFLIHALVK